MLSSDIPDQPESNENHSSGAASPGTQSVGTETHARGPQAQRVTNEDDCVNQIPRDAWEDHSGDFPPRIASLSTKTVAMRGGQLVSITGENFRGGVQVVLICGQFGDGRTSLKVITPRIRTSTELEFDSPCLLDWWQQASSKRPTSTLVFQVSLSCSGVVPDPEEMSSQFEIAGREDSEVDLLHTVVGLHRQVLRNTIQTGSPADDTRTLQRTQTLLDLDQPSDVSKTEHLALGAMYMLCDANDQISAKSLHQIMMPFPDGGHDILHLATILGLSTLVREICRHLLSHADPESIEAFYTKDTNNMTALDFATLLSHKDIQDILEVTLAAAKDVVKTMSAFQSASIGSNANPKSNPARPLPKLPSKERPNKATTMPIKLSPSMLHAGLPPGTPPSPMPASTTAGTAVGHPSPTVAALDRPLPPTPLGPAPTEGDAIASTANAQHQQHDYPHQQHDYQHQQHDYQHQQHDYQHQHHDHQHQYQPQPQHQQYQHHYSSGPTTPPKPPRFNTAPICLSPSSSIPSSPPPPLPMPMAATPHTEASATPVAVTAPPEYTAAPEPMYPPPSTAPTTYAPPSHPPPPTPPTPFLHHHHLASQPLPVMPLPTPSSANPAPVPHEYAHLHPGAGAGAEAGLPPPPGSPMPGSMAVSAPLPPLVQPLYPPPQGPPPPPLSTSAPPSSSFPGPQHLHYAPPSQSPPPPVPALPLYHQHQHHPHGHSYYPPSHPPPPGPPAAVPGMPGYAHYGLSPSSSPHIVSGKLPSGGSSPVMVPPVPPPRHKVTKVNRPKDFVIPATRSGSSGQDTSGSGSGGTSRRRQTIAS